jgi:hypothetical protein
MGANRLTGSYHVLETNGEPAAGAVVAARRSEPSAVVGHVGPLAQTM